MSLGPAWESWTRLLRLSHDEAEYDLGFMIVKIMKSLGLVEATRRGAELPQDIPLTSLNF